MAFDGITIANMVKEFQDTIVGGKINKIAQQEADELLITIKKQQDSVPSPDLRQCFPSIDLFYR